jgi:HptB-dependent secretion and biofilm anti anti-sigma factor
MTPESFQEGQRVRLRVSLDTAANIPVGTIGTVIRASQQILSVRFDEQVIHQIPTGDVAPIVIESAIRRPKKDVILALLNGRMAFGDDLQLVKAQLASLAGERGIILILDLSKVEYVDSSGLGVLLYLDGVAHEAGSTLRVAGATRRVLEVIKVAHTDKILTLDPDVASSLSHSA